MLESFKKSYMSPKNNRDHSQIIWCGGVPENKLPPGCINADRWNYEWQSAAQMEQWLFDNLTEKNGDKIHRTSFSHGEGGEDGWAWQWSIGEMRDLLTTGWKEIAAEITPLSLIISNSIVAETEEDSLEADNTGSEVNIDAFIHGLPENMMDFKITKQHGQQVTIEVGGFYPCGEDGTATFRRGLIIGAAVLALQAQGIAVSVRLVMENEQSNGRSKRADGSTFRTDQSRLARFTVWLLRPGDTLDISTLIIRLAHPGWMRCVFYSMTELLVGSTNGYEPNDTPEILPGIVPVPEAGNRIYGNEKTAVQFITQLMEAAI